MKSAKRHFALLVSLLALAACQSDSEKQDPAICPRVSGLADSMILTRFRPGDGRDIADVQMKAEMTSFHGECRYDAEQKKMLITLNVGIDAERRPALKGRTADLSYFVAIPAFYPDPQAKVLMPVRLEFSDNSNRVHYTDSEVELAIPISDLKQVAKYEVFLGLQLTPDEVAFNRKQHGPR